MKRMTHFAALMLMGLTGTASSDVTVGQLVDLLQADNRPTLIDIRSKNVYQAGHIPGAINIPASLVPHKKLPPLGRVIVYGDGIDVAKTESATAQLNQLKGIQAEKLLGGMGSWQTMNMPDTRGKGMRKQNVYQISYQELQKISAGNADTVLVDMRHGQQLSDLNTLFPQAAVIRPWARGRKEQSLSLNKISQKGVDPGALYVLIDDGDGQAERGARRLTSAGVKRIAILAGGELILKREGKTGREVRVSSGGEK